jgi:hypothetical protein
VWALGLDYDRLSANWVGIGGCNSKLLLFAAISFGLSQSFENKILDRDRGDETVDLTSLHSG